MLVEVTRLMSQFGERKLTFDSRQRSVIDFILERNEIRHFAICVYIGDRVTSQNKAESISELFTSGTELELKRMEIR